MPKLFLHIGRNKAGSTTLQHAWLDRADELRARGVAQGLFTDPARAPAGDLPVFRSHLELIAHARALPAGLSLLVSNEGLCMFQEPFARCMAEDLRQLDVRVLYWLRPYPEWLASSYSFDVRIGAFSGGLDDYLRDHEARVSARPALELWGEALGFDRLRVRSLHPADLDGGDLARDGWAALDLAWPGGRPPPAANVSPPAAVTELVGTVLRDLASRAPPAAALPVDRLLRLAEVIHHYLLAAAMHEGVVLPPAARLDGATGERLAGLYDADLDWLHERTGVRLQRALRPSSPGEATALEAVPAVLLRRMEQFAHAPGAAPELAEVVAAPSFRRLAGAP